MSETRDAYREPQRVRPGCQHQLGCRCDPPYWMRASSLAELAHEAQLHAALMGHLEPLPTQLRGSKAPERDQTPAGSPG